MNIFRSFAAGLFASVSLAGLVSAQTSGTDQAWVSYESLTAMGPAVLDGSYPQVGQTLGITPTVPAQGDGAQGLAVYIDSPSSGYSVASYTSALDVPRASSVQTASASQGYTSSQAQTVPMEELDSLTAAAVGQNPVVRGPDGRLYMLPLQQPVQPRRFRRQAYVNNRMYREDQYVPNYTSSTQRAPLAVGAHIGTLGAGMNATLFLNNRYSITGVFDTFDINVDAKTGDFDDLNLDADNFSAGLYFNIHPNHTDFRISAGLQKGAPGAYATMTRDFDGTQITYTGEMNSEWDYGPYLGVGIGSRNSSTRGFSVYGDLGVAYLGRVDNDFQQSAACSSLSGDLEAKCDDSAVAFKDLLDVRKGEYFYPVARLGLSYRF